MIQIARILCPLDFSAFSRHALDHAAALAGWYDATLTALYVVQNRAVTDLPALAMDQEERGRITDQMRAFTAHLPFRAKSRPSLCCPAAQVVESLIE